MTRRHQNRMRLLMQSAWNLARNGAKQFGGKPSEYIRMAMRLVWSDRNKAPQGVYYPGLGIHFWLPGVERKVWAKRGQYVLPGIAL